MGKLAVIQEAPVLLNREATIEKAVAALQTAAAQGADVIVFPEAYIPGYPVWIWGLRPGGDMALTSELHARLAANAVSIDRGDLNPLLEAAREHGVTVVCGMDEIDSGSSQTTLYNTIVIIGPNGEIQNRHRKVMPTNAERMVWGYGDGAGLKTVGCPSGRIGALICWENLMPQARLSLYAQGVELYIAPTFDNGDVWLASMQHIAYEGRCWVVGSGFALNSDDIPKELPGRDQLFPEEGAWINPGDSVVVAPGGEIAAGPLRGEYGILYAEIDPAAVKTARRALDVAGHYARPDIFQLHVNRDPQQPVVFDEDG